MEQSKDSLQLNVQADVKSRMSPPARQLVAQIFMELRIYLATVYACKHAWQAKRVPIG